MYRGLGFLLCALLLGGAKFSLAQENVQANPTRPSAADNAYLTHYGYSELEFGVLSQPHSWNLPTLLKCTVHPNLEMGLLMSGLLVHSDGSTNPGDPGVQAKARLLRTVWGAFAVVARGERAQNHRRKFTFYSVLSLQSGHVSFDGTFGYAFLSRKNRTGPRSWQYATALNFSLGPAWGGFVELFGEHSSDFNPLSIDGGLAYSLTRKFVVDVALTKGISEDAENWVIQAGWTTVLFRILK